MVGVGEYRHESPTARYFSLILMIVIGFFWVIFFVADSFSQSSPCWGLDSSLLSHLACRETKAP